MFIRQVCLCVLQRFDRRIDRILIGGLVVIIGFVVWSKASHSSVLILIEGLTVLAISSARFDFLILLISSFDYTLYFTHASIKY